MWNTRRKHGRSRMRFSRSMPGCSPPEAFWFSTGLWRAGSARWMRARERFCGRRRQGPGLLATPLPLPGPMANNTSPFTRALVDGWARPPSRISPPTTRTPVWGRSGPWPTLRTSPHQELRFMSTASKLVALLALGCATVAYAATATLRVCADPNNLPFSNRAQRGFENQLADMVAHDLGMTVSYYWFPQRSKFFKKTLNAGNCDVVMGLPTNIDVANTTVPYYHSSYVFVSRRDRHLNVKSMDDPRLHQLRSGVHVTGDEEDNLPPVNALIRRGIVRNIVGYNIYGNLDE